MGSPFAGNLEVYPVYRTLVTGGIADGRQNSDVGVLTLGVFPNPCLGKAAIKYSLPRSGNVSLKLYDMTGRCAKVMVDAKQAAGRHSVTLDRTGTATRLAAGVYFCRLSVGDQKSIKKLVIE